MTPNNQMKWDGTVMPSPAGHDPYNSRVGMFYVIDQAHARSVKNLFDKLPPPGTHPLMVPRGLYDRMV